ncbi:MinD/ParA family ATP-binding protein [Naasia lichenicola]|nr:MinD/ParA family protein [Naasia lichenicola]
MNRRKKPEAAGQLLETEKASAEFDELEFERLHGELAEESDAALASRLPDSLTVTIDMPAEIAHVVPDDERAVSIDDVAIAPTTLPATLTGEVNLRGALESQGLPTTSLPTTGGPESSDDGDSTPPVDPSPRTAPFRRTGSAYDSLLGGPVFTSQLAATGEVPRMDRRNTGEIPRVETFRADRRHSTGEVPRLEPSTPPEGNQITRRDHLRGARQEGPESASMLTADRLITGHAKRHLPTGGWNKFVYAVTFHQLNLGDSAAERARKELNTRIAKQLEGGSRFVPILTRKGGVGKTTVTTLLGMALATTREDRIIAIDANPDRGTLSERVTKQTRATVRDVVHRAASITGFTDFSTLVSRDETRLDILASDTDPLLSEAFDENDYNVVADLAARYYSIVLTDCGTGIVHSVMRATLNRADSVVIVSGGSVDEARLASETLTWLEANGYGALVKNAIVALNTATQGTNLVKLDEIESHFKSRVRDIVRIPYDPLLAAGSVVSYKDLKQVTKDAARTLAGLVLDGLPARRGA